MKKSINDQIKALQSGANSQEEFMKKLAELDENGPLTPELMNQVNGGASIKGTSPLIDLPVLGVWLPPQEPTIPTNEAF